MKRSLLILSALFLCLVYWACRKNDTQETLTKFQDPFVSTAMAYLKHKISNEDFDKLDFNSVQLLKEDQKTTGVIIHFKNSQNLRSIIIGEKDKAITGNWLTVENKNTNNASGIIHTESLDGALENVVTYIDNRVVKLVKTDHGITKTTVIKYPKENQLGGKSAVSSDIGSGIQISEGIHDDDPHWLPNIIIPMSLNQTTTNFYSLFWSFNQNASYIYSYTTVPPNGGNGGGGGVTAANTFTAPTFVSPDHPIPDIRIELKCFTISSTATYTIKVNINQPRPGSRDLVDLSNPHSVGHTYLTLIQNGSSGTIIRNVGFYPQNFAKPGASQDMSVFGDDSNTPASVVLAITVNSSDFNTVVQNVIRQASKPYNLDTYNCTTSGIDALNSINIHLPATIRNNNFVSPFTGNDPGDLGEDIRALNMPTFIQQNGNRQVVRSLSNSNSLMPSPRTGSCN